jgi:hypothetical protein
MAINQDLIDAMVVIDAGIDHHGNDDQVRRKPEHEMNPWHLQEENSEKIVFAMDILVTLMDDMYATYSVGSGKTQKPKRPG